MAKLLVANLFTTSLVNATRPYWSTERNFKCPSWRNSKTSVRVEPVTKISII